MLTLLVLLAAGPVTHRSAAAELRLRCERDGFVDVRDFGACGWAKVNEAEAVKAAEEHARSCIPGRVLPVRYCPGKPNS